jgi:hypothetical protein
MSGRFEPEKMPDKYADAVRELVRAKVENRAPEVTIEADGEPKAPVINIMDALKQSMQKQGQTKVHDAVRKRMGKAAPKRDTVSTRNTRARSPSAQPALRFFLSQGTGATAAGVRLEAKHAAGPRRGPQ